MFDMRRRVVNGLGKVGVQWADERVLSCAVIGGPIVEFIEGEGRLWYRKGKTRRGHLLLMMMESFFLEALLLLLLLLLTLKEMLTVLDEVAQIREVFWGVGNENTRRDYHRVVVAVVVGGGRE